MSLDTLLLRYPDATCRTQLVGWLVAVDSETGRRVKSLLQTFLDLHVSNPFYVTTRPSLSLAGVRVRREPKRRFLYQGANRCWGLGCYCN